MLLCSAPELRKVFAQFDGSRKETDAVLTRPTGAGEKSERKTVVFSMLFESRGPLR